MASKIKLVLDDNSAFCDISGDKMEITTMLVRLLLRQEQLKGLLEVAIVTVNTLQGKEVKTNKGIPPQENKS